MESSFNILIAGVGGQGNLVCGRALAQAAILHGKRPVLGDTFGASRRGGSVLSHLRISDGDMGPLVPRGHADVIVGMEPVEGLRAATQFASQKTIAVISTAPVHSPATRSGEYEYPQIERIEGALKNLCSAIYSFDPKSALDRIGTYRVLNVFMLGVLVGLNVTPLSREEIESGIQKVVGFDDVSNDAFTTGIDEGYQALKE